MYLETVDWATSNPTSGVSPWIRGAPHSGFSLLIRQMRSRRLSRSTFGRPTLLPDFQRQKARNPSDHGKMVSGFTTGDISSKLGQIRVIHTKEHVASRGRLIGENVESGA